MRELTKQDVLMAGKNVVFMTQIPRSYPFEGADDLCDYHDESGARRYLDWVWIGVDRYSNYGVYSYNEALGQNDNNLVGDTPSSHYEYGNFSLRLDSTTEYTANGDGHPEVWGSDVLDAAEQGYNILELTGLFEHDGAVHASTADGLWRSVDGGVSWSDASVELSGLLRVNGDHLYAGTAGHGLIRFTPE